MCVRLQVLDCVSRLQILDFVSSLQVLDVVSRLEVLDFVYTFIDFLLQFCTILVVFQ